MPMSSMTGFARIDGETTGRHWAWELKSVNGRGLDVRCRLPSGLDALEATIRKRVPKHLTRGQVSVNLQILNDSDEPSVTINEGLAEALLEVGEKLANRFTISPPRLDGLLALPGVVKVEAKSVTDQDHAVLLNSFDQALEALKQARLVEGGTLNGALNAIVTEIRQLVAQAKSHAASQAPAIKAKLTQQINDLVENEVTINEDRLAQEIAIMASKADVREELDRLVGHIDRAQELLAEDKPVGRPFDFLCQEFNREANTLCAKSNDQGLTDIGLALKTAVDQLREQVQNVE